MKYLLFFYLIFLGLYANGQHTYQLEWRKETTIFTSASLMFAGSFYIDSKREPLLIPAPGSILPPINKLDRGTLDYYSPLSRTASDVLFYSLTAAPFTVLTSSKIKNDRLEYLIMYSEVIALNGGFTFLVKSAVNRKRPYFFNEEVPLEERQNIDARKSFFSGHTSHASALSFFTARVFSDLYPESDWRFVVWGAAGVFPAATAYLRVRAGRHFPTDVIVGYGVGTGIGLLVPYLHRVKINRNQSMVLSGTSNGLAFTIEF
ncbi:phosphatase PAP2 family protein [Portibacter marinus]|uniref:phosphatase PAP2 family protein n=1 Tax=Portibacter marinus TaxID=2898660 RepID=UPI001F3C42F8|nr:phosphatase PAP2 family protein [Portibacter marinus]